ARSGHIQGSPELELGHLPVRHSKIIRVSILSMAERAISRRCRRYLKGVGSTCIISDSLFFNLSAFMVKLNLSRR
ncbi:hypothetical protein PILCRDRAFT_795674, partial [Piloderma croceum F 1598]